MFGLRKQYVVVPGFPQYTPEDFGAYFSVDGNAAAKIRRDYVSLLNGRAPDSFLQSIVDPGFNHVHVSEIMSRRYVLDVAQTTRVATYFSRIGTVKASQTRHLRMGIESSTWQTRTCRHFNRGHIKFDGREFKTSIGIVTGKSTLLPGAALGCNCRASPVVPIFDDQ